MYFSKNFPSKRAARDAVASGERVTIWQPGPFGGGVVPDGKHFVEGPHYPEPHRFYGTVIVKDGQVVKVT